VVTVQRRGRISHRHVTDAVYGGKRAALDAAKTYRDGLVLSLYPLTRSERCRIRKTHNRSGGSGVTSVDALEKDPRANLSPAVQARPMADRARQGSKEEVFYHAIRRTWSLSAGSTCETKGAEASCLESLASLATQRLMYGYCHAIIQPCLLKSLPSPGACPKGKVGALT
jgi:hypothetical protein